MIARYHPDGHDHGALAFTSLDELADAIEARVTSHFAEHGSRLRVIRLAHDPYHVQFGHLARYGVPLLAIDTGKRDKPRS